MEKPPPNGYKDTPEELRPRERLMRTGNPAELSDEDLLAILLKTGFPGCDVWELSHRLLCAFHSLNELVRADVRTVTARIEAYNKRRPDRPIRHVGAVKLMDSRRRSSFPDAPTESSNTTFGR